MKRTPRGFAIYAETTDSRGQGVRVQQSSAMGEPFVWIFCSPPAGEQKCEEHRPALAPDNERACSCRYPHLTVAQAKRLRDGLDRFIRENTKTTAAARRKER